VQTKLSAEDWQRIGDQAKFAREELSYLHKLSAGHMPKEITRYILSAIAQLDHYRSKAEDRMLQSGTSDDLRIFYGEKVRSDA